MNIRVLTVCFLMCVMAVPVGAQSYSQNIEKISELNLVNPTRNPKYDRSSKVLSRHIIDRKSKVIGQVKDVIIEKNGSIKSLNVDLDRLRLGLISLNYRQLGMKSVSNAYALSIEDDQVKDIYPTLLADIETASGDTDESFSIRKIIGVPVKTKDGRMVGKVKDIIFNESATRVEALYVKLNARGAHVAIPFGRSIIIKNNGQRNEVIIDKAMAAAAMDFAKNKK